MYSRAISTTDAPKPAATFLLPWDRHTLPAPSTVVYTRFLNPGLRIDV